MNKDQLLDAIGMVDERKIRDAVMVKRTKWISGTLALLAVLFVLVLSILLFGFYRWFFVDTDVEYTPSHIAKDIDNATVVTVSENPADRQSRYTVYVPDGTSQVMRFEEWVPVDPQTTDDLQSLLTLQFHDLSLVFYDGGCVHAQKHDWDDYVGVYTVPENLWCEVLLFLAEE